MLYNTLLLTCLLSLFEKKANVLKKCLYLLFLVQSKNQLCIFIEIVCYQLTNVETDIFDNVMLNMNRIAEKEKKNYYYQH